MRTEARMRNFESKYSATGWACGRSYCACLEKPQACGRLCPSVHPRRTSVPGPWAFHKTAEAYGLSGRTYSSRDKGIAFRSNRLFALSVVMPRETPIRKAEAIRTRLNLVCGKSGTIPPRDRASCSGSEAHGGQESHTKCQMPASNWK